jgi:DNA-binding CsgD family transcriptional regulator
VATKQLYVADIYNRTGDHERAAGLFRELLDFFQDRGDIWGIGFALGGLGDSARFLGNYPEALRCFRESIEGHYELRDRTDIAFVMEALAIALGEMKRFEQSARLWGFAETLRSSIHSSVPRLYQAGYIPQQEEVRAALGEQAYERIWGEGSQMSLQDGMALAISYASKQEDLPPGPGSGEDIPGYGLTARELEVLRLVARGLTDAQVAEELVISPRTVSKHLQSIYGKLQVNSRSAATRFALEHGIE